jgi:tetratricopeptide (TPR) repeat protein
LGSLLGQSALASAAPSSDTVLPARTWSRLAAESWLERAERLARLGETLSAITSYTEAVRADPTLGRAYFGLAEIRRLQGDVREAERLLTRAVTLSDARVEALARRAELYRSLGRMNDALSDWSRAAELDPSLGRLRQLAAGYVERRAWVAALAVWRRIRTLVAPSASRDELRDVEDTLSALVVLAAEADSVQHDAGEHNWVRRALRHYVLH